MVDLKKLANTPVEGSTSPDQLPEGAHTDATDIEEMFDLAMQRHPSDFLDSLYEWWEDKGFLTERQYEKLIEVIESG